MDPIEEPVSHPGEEALEAYALRRLPEAQVASIEEHLLTCEACRRTLGQADDFIRLMRAALREPVAPPQEGGSRLARLPRLRVAPHGIWAAGLAVVCMIAVSLPWSPDHERESAAVMLSSFRGSQEVSMAHGPARSPLELGIDAGYLAAGEDCRIEIVDVRGRPAWNGQATTTAEGRLLARVSKPLGAGIYWVRLYGADARLVQEFGLELE